MAAKSYSVSTSQYFIVLTVFFLEVVELSYEAFSDIFKALTFF
jgi:hypothetical protein